MSFRVVGYSSPISTNQKSHEEARPSLLSELDQRVCDIRERLSQERPYFLGVISEIEDCQRLVHANREALRDDQEKYVAIFRSFRNFANAKHEQYVNARSKEEGNRYFLIRKLLEGLEVETEAIAELLAQNASYEVIAERYKEAKKLFNDAEKQIPSSASSSQMKVTYQQHLDRLHGLGAQIHRRFLKKEPSKTQNLRAAMPSESEIYGYSWFNESKNFPQTLNERIQTVRSLLERDAKDEEISVAYKDAKLYFDWCGQRISSMNDESLRSKYLSEFTPLQQKLHALGSQISISLFQKQKRQKEMDLAAEPNTSYSIWTGFPLVDSNSVL